MNSYGAVPQGMQFTVEVIVAAMIAIFFVVSSAMTLKERHFDTPAWHVHLGAAIYGAIFGIIVGFVIVPLRMVLQSGSVPPQTAAYSGLGFLVVMIVLRRGLIGRLPFLGPQVKAYRRAALRRAIETSQKQLEKLTPKTAPAE